MEKLTCTGGIITKVQIRAFILVSNSGFSVLVAFIHWEGRVVIQVNSGQRLVAETAIFTDLSVKVSSAIDPDTDQKPLQTHLQ